MSDTSGPTSYAPFAKWDRDSQCWKTSEATSLWALTLSSVTLPQWGGLHDGELCEHRTPELATSAPDYSSLPTPAAMLGASDVDFQVSGDGRTKPNKLGWAIGEMLPTPRTSDTNGAGHHGTGGPDLRTAITMLPTPSAADGLGGHLNRSGDRSGELLLPGLVKTFLPTPAVNDMGEGKTLEWWDDWAPRQKSSDGRPAPHGRSLAIEAQRLLPTPRAQDEYERRNMKTMERIRDEGGDMTLPTWAKVVATLPTPAARDAKGPHMAERNGGLCLARAVGETTAPPSPDGSASQDDQPQRQLSLDELAHPA